MRKIYEIICNLGAILLVVLFLFWWIIVPVILIIGSFIDWEYYIIPMTKFFKENIYLILAIISIITAAWVFVAYKPHPAEAHVEAYKKGAITRKKAVELVASTMYVPSKKIPLAIQSKIMTKRITALNRRIKAETEFIEDLVKYLRVESIVKERKTK